MGVIALHDMVESNIFLRGESGRVFTCYTNSYMVDGGFKFEINGYVRRKY